MAHICKKCLLREMAEEDAKRMEQYLAAIRPGDKVGSGEYERRLAICKTCDFLQEGTCGVCGCYVELRAAARTGKCPHKKWTAS